jgi:fibronectin-binding autotransporter adhesin
LGQGLTVQNGCTVIVGAGTNVAGTLTVSNGLTELGNVLNQFDLSSDPTGLTNASDRVNVVGNLVLNGTNTIEVEQLNGFLGSGVYPLFSYTGTLTGGLTNLALTGNFIQFVVLTNPPGVIGLLATIPSAPPAAPSGLTAIAVGAFQIILSWTDNSTNENAFLIERSTNNVIFAQIASVASGTTNYSDFGLTPNTTYYYRVRGTNLAGASGFSNTANATTPGTPPSLTWRGDGTLNVWDIATTANWFDGTNLSLYADGAFVTFNDSGSNSPTINLATNLQPGSVTINAGKNYTFGGAGTLTGAMTLVKSGSGTLTIAMANSFTGGVSANAGTVALGNAAGAGAGPLIFNGGTVSFTVGNQPTYANPLNVIAPSTLVSAGGNNNIVSGAWSGTNTLNLSVATGTFTLGGNMNNFFGTVALGSSAGYFRFYGSTGSTNTTFDLGNGTVTLNNRNGVTVTLGALTGGSGTFVSGAGAADAPSTYIVGGKNLNTTFDGTIKDASASRITSLTKVGTGTLTLTGSNAYSGTTTISGGTLLVNGNQTAATNSVTVGVTGALGGTGTIGGATTVNGTLAPGNSAIGTLTFSKNLTLVGGGMALFEISRSPFTNDMVVVAGNLTCVGTLNVVNTSPDLLEAGDNFKLFDAAGYGGSFTNFNLPDLDEGLAWSTNKLVVDGRLWVVSTNPPAIEHVTVSGGNFTLNGSGGTPGWNYFLLTSTRTAISS